MSSGTTYVADREKILADILSARDEGWRGVLRVFRVTLLIVSMASLLLFALHWWESGGAPGNLVPYVGIPLIVAVVLTVNRRFPSDRPTVSVVDRIADRAERDWVELEGFQGIVRVSLWGLAAAFVIGTVVGALLAGSTEIVRGGRLLNVAVFCLLTAAWTIPGCLIIRLAGIRSLRKVQQ